MSGLNFACLLTSNVGGLKSHDSRASYSIIHGLKVFNASGLNSACQLNSNMNIGALPRRCRPFSRTESCGSENKKDLGEDTSRE